MKKLSEISLLALLFVIVMSIIFVIPWAFTNETWFTGVSFENTGNIGDTIGGLTAPFLNGLSAILVFFAFREQIKANKLFHGMEQKKSTWRNTMIYCQKFQTSRPILRSGFSAQSLNKIRLS